MTDLVAFNDGCAPPPFIHTQPRIRALSGDAQTPALLSRLTSENLEILLVRSQVHIHGGQIEKKRGAAYVSPHDSPVSPAAVQLVTRR